MDFVVPAAAGTQKVLQQQGGEPFRRIVVCNHSPNDVYFSAGYRVSPTGADHVVRAHCGLALPLDTDAVAVLVDPAGAADPSAESRVEVTLDTCPSEQASSWQLADVLDYRDTHSGQYAEAAADVAIALDTRSGQVQIWNRDSTETLYVNFGNTVTTKGGTDLQLLPGEFWHGSIATRQIHYQGGAMQLEVFA